MGMKKAGSARVFFYFTFLTRSFKEEGINSRGTKKA